MLKLWKSRPAAPRMMTLRIAPLLSSRGAGKPGPRVLSFSSCHLGWWTCPFGPDLRDRSSWWFLSATQQGVASGFVPGVTLLPVRGSHSARFGTLSSSAPCWRRTRTIDVGRRLMHLRDRGEHGSGSPSAQAVRGARLQLENRSSAVSAVRCHGSSSLLDLTQIVRLSGRFGIGAGAHTGSVVAHAGIGEIPDATSWLPGRRSVRTRRPR